MGWFTEHLSDKRNLERAFDQICLKVYKSKHRVLKFEEFHFQHLIPYKKQIISEIQQCFEKKVFQYKPFEKIIVQVREKKRIIYKLELFDLIIHTTAAHILNEKINSHFSSQLYSYRRGWSNRQAIHSFSKYLRAHVGRIQNPLDRGLFVLRRDVKNYGDSIPLTSESHLWKSIRLALNHDPPDQDDWNCLRSLICPIVSKDQIEMTNFIGLATGSPLSGLLTNLYLSDLDHQFGGMKQAQYYRYGDDILFATKNELEFLEVQKQLDEHVIQRRLEFGKEKSKNVFFNGAGKAHLNYPGAQYVEFLGVRINFKGHLSLPNKKEKLLFTDLKERLKNGVQSSVTFSQADQLQLACQIFNDMFVSPQTHKVAHYADWLLQWLDDRSYLKHLDHRVRLRIAENLSGISGVHAFRKIPPKKLITEGQLVSLLKKRNAA